VGGAMEEIRALIVDDDPEIGDLLRSYLASYGVLANAVANGTAMRTAMAAIRYHVIILDLMLPRRTVCHYAANCGPKGAFPSSC